MGAPWLLIGLLLLGPSSVSSAWISEVITSLHAALLPQWSWRTPAEDSGARQREPRLSAAQGDVHVLWGVPDVVATVGQLLRFVLPTNAFQGRVESYQMHAVAGAEPLPGWLYFNQTSLVLYGVASSVDLGSVLVTMTAYGAPQPDNATGRAEASTVFLLRVQSCSQLHPAWIPTAPTASQQRVAAAAAANQEGPTSASQQGSKCSWDESVIRASLILDASMATLTSPARVSILYKASHFLQRSVLELVLMPKKKQSVSRLLDIGRDIRMLVAGPGNVQLATDNAGVDLSWRLSCGQLKDTAAVTSLMQHNINTDRFTQELGYKVLGWYVTETLPPEHILRARRNKRQAGLATPLPTPSVYSSALPATSVETAVPASTTTVTGSDTASTASPEPLYSSVGMTTVPSPSSADIVTMTTAPLPSSSDIVTMTAAPLPSSSDIVTMTAAPLPSSSDIVTMTAAPLPSSSDIVTMTTAPLPSSSDILSMATAPAETAVYPSMSGSTSRGVITTPPLSTQHSLFASTASTQPIVNSIPPSHTWEWTPSSDLQSSIMPTRTQDISSMGDTPVQSPACQTACSSGLFDSSQHIFASMSSMLLASSAVRPSSPVSPVMSSVGDVSTTWGLYSSSLAGTTPSMTVSDLGSLASSLATVPATMFPTSFSMYTPQVTVHSTGPGPAKSSIEVEPPITLSSSSDPQLMAASSAFTHSSVASNAAAASTLGATELYPTRASTTRVSSSTTVNMDISSTTRIAVLSTSMLFSATTSIPASLTTASSMLHTTAFPQPTSISSNAVSTSLSQTTSDQFTIPLTTNEVTIPITISEVTIPVTTSDITIPITKNEVTIPITTNEVTFPITTIEVTIPITKVTIPITTNEVTVPITSKKVTVPITTNEVTVPITTDEVTVPITTNEVTVPITTNEVTVPITTNEVTVPITTKEVTVPITTNEVTVPITTNEVTVPITTNEVTVPITTNEVTVPIITSEVTTPITTNEATFPVTTSAVSSPVRTSAHGVSLIPTTPADPAAGLPTTTDPAWHVTTAAPNTAPKLVNAIDKVVSKLGTYFEFVVPAGTFYDFEDGPTRDLNVSLTTVDGKELEPLSWVMFDANRQLIYGLPLYKDVTVFPAQYVVTATDSQGLTARDVIQITIDTQAVQRLSHVFHATFKLDYATFTLTTTNNLIQLMWRLGSYYGDESPVYSTVLAISNGSVTVEWTNNSLSKDVCQNATILELYDLLSLRGGGVNPAFARAMLPEYPVGEVGYEFGGVCLDGEQNVDSSTEGPALGGSDDVNVYLVSVLPAVLVVAVLVIVAVVLCVICRRRHQAGRYLPEDEKPIYSKNRKPVLMPGETELKELNNRPTKPMVLHTEADPYTYANPSGGPRAPPPYHIPYAGLYTAAGAEAALSPPGYTSSPIGEGYTQPPPPYRLPPPYLHGQDLGYRGSSEA